MSEALTIYRLRMALHDACQGCEKCKGTGEIAIAGGTVRCSKCVYWRETLKATADRPPWWLRVGHALRLVR